MVRNSPFNDLDDPKKFVPMIEDIIVRVEGCLIVIGQPLRAGSYGIIETLFLELFFTFFRCGIEQAFPMCGQEEIAPSLGYASKFFEPRKLHVFWQVREHGDGIYKIKEPVSEAQRRSFFILDEFPDVRQLVPAPCDRFCIYIRSIKTALPG